MGDNLTDSQKKAIKNIDNNIIVNAGAGTGKTRVLTERYIHILENGSLNKDKEIESIVAITFTKKAAQEMKSRIRAELKARFNIDNKWRRYYRDFEKANISTIHSFCSDILRESAIEANIDPQFKVVEAIETEDILSNIVLNEINDRNSYNNELYKLLYLFKQDNIENLSVNIINIFKKIKSNGYTISEISELTVNKLQNLEIPEDIDNSIIEDFQFLMAGTNSNSKFNKLKNQSIWELYNNKDFSTMDRLNIISEFKNYIGASKKNEKIVNRLNENINLALFEKEKEYLWAYTEIIKILFIVEELYNYEKERLQIIDFNDLEYKTYELLKNNMDIRKKYQNKYNYIMVDEFQDSNRIQKEIFYLLSSRDEKLDKNNLFVVGDPKQSIYGFRGADLTIFKEVIDDIESIDDDNHILLDRNFRSKDIIINFVNFIFSDFIPLDFYHKSKDIKEIEIIDSSELEIEGDISKSLYSKIYEANVIGERILELVNSHRYEYKDIAILFRAGTNDYIYEMALKERDIPFYNIGGDNLYNTQEIIDIINILKAINNSYDSISNIGFLRSPLSGLNDESIYYILDNLKLVENKNIINTLKNIELKDSDENIKLKNALELLIDFKLKKSIYPMDKLVLDILDRTNYLELLLLYENGEQRVNNIYKLIDIIRNLNAEKSLNLDELLKYFNTVESLGVFESQRNIQSENSNVVKIMTIHKSKGLEFPVVILPEMSRGQVRETDNIIYNKDLGLGLKYASNGSQYTMVKELNAENEEAEAERVLYVALTRAEELLIIGNQGDNRGFKKLLKDIDEFSNIRYIEGEITNNKINDNYKNIESNLIIENPVELYTPNLIEFDNYNNRVFKNINISQFLEYNNCKRKFYLEYYNPLPENYYKIFNNEVLGNIIDPKERGNIIHKFIELYTDRDNKKILLQRIINNFGYKYTIDLENELIPYIDNYLKYDFGDYDRIHNETNFYLKIEDIYIRGIIDRVYIKDNKAYIYDFKTNKVGDKDSLKEYYKPQLLLYSYGFEKLYNIKVELAAILFLHDNNLVEIDISKEEIDNNIDGIKEFYNFINNNSDIEDYIKSNSCSQCKYTQLCNMERE